MRFAMLALLVGGLACAKHSPNEQVGAARDTTNPGVDSSRMTDTDTSTTTEADSTRAW